MTLPALIIAGVVAAAALSGIVVFVLLRQSQRAAEETQRQMRESFALLSRDALQQTHASLQQSNAALLQTADQTLRARQEAIDELIKPVRETLERVRQQVANADKDRAGSYHAVKEQLSSLNHTQELLRKSADGLAGALRSPNMRGKWGELQLKRIVELAGMLEHCDFEQQVSSAGDSRLRPDLTIHLPGNAAIVVDAKVPIDAYLKATEAKGNEAEQQRHLDAHVTAVRSHIRALSAKKYWEQFGESSPQFVVLFLPLEPLMHAAFERDGELLELAASQSVVLATPMTLLALLRAVSAGWTQLSTAKNAEAIRDTAIELSERLTLMLDHFDNVGDHLKKAIDAFNSAVGSFDSRVMPSVAKLRELKLPHAGKIELPATQPDFLRHFESPDADPKKRPN